MTIVSPGRTVCLGCKAPTGAADGATATEERRPEEKRPHLDERRWCTPCWRHQDEWDRFYRLYQPRLFGFILTRLRDVLPANEDCLARAEEITQETMLVAHRKYTVWELPERALWQTARRLVYAACSDYTFMTDDGTRVTVRYAEENAWEGLNEEVQCDPADAVIDRIVLFRALDGLTVEQRQALIVHKAIGVPAAEAAKVLGRPATTVKTQAQSGLHKLKRAAAGGALTLIPVAGAVAAYETLRRTPVGAVAGRLVDSLADQPLLLTAAGVGVQQVVAYVRDTLDRRRSGSAGGSAPGGPESPTRKRATRLPRSRRSRR
ncbi:RNA polymerase sigma factor [Streptomyces sp. NPDC047972]|uniref:RNA polymerase sigma factor n=1 Tax=Streptomyces sp. NPDC047972 TaxID=3365493 RepID=UPI0037176C0E